MTIEISEWLDCDGFDVAEFFLKKRDYKELYEDTYNSYEQLSPKGLAILSYLYAQKDNLERQPVVASTIDAFRHAIQLIATAAEGTQLTIIFQATDVDSIASLAGFRICPLHKTTCKLERREKDVLIINLDSTLSENKPSFCEFIARTTLANIDMPYIFYQRDTTPLNEIKKQRQEDWYQCGIFATKDARQLNRDLNFSTRLNPSSSEKPGWYDLPIEYLKSIQNAKYRKQILSTHGNDIVNRKKNTIKELYKKYSSTEMYTGHFSKKYYHLITDFLEQNKAEPDFVKTCTKMYDASCLTLERLASIYGPDSYTIESPGV